MGMLERWNEAFFRSPGEAEAYVTSELAHAVPKGWRLGRIGDGGLAWEIVKQDVAADEWSPKDYRVFVSNGLDFIIITHGNDDVGPLSLHHMLQQALIIQTAALRGYRLAACVEHVMSHYKPNEWGYT